MSRKMARQWIYSSSLTFIFSSSGLFVLVLLLSEFIPFITQFIPVSYWNRTQSINWKQLWIDFITIRLFQKGLFYMRIVNQFVEGKLLNFLICHIYIIVDYSIPMFHNILISAPIFEYVNGLTDIRNVMLPYSHRSI